MYNIEKNVITYITHIQGFIQLYNSVLYPEVTWTYFQIYLAQSFQNLLKGHMHH